MPLFILMGVSGSGKTTIGKLVSEREGLQFFEGDDYHPPANVAKMSAGIPLQDADRMQWIDDLMAAVNASRSNRVLVACSALTAAVRARIAHHSKRPVHFIHLTTDPALIDARLKQRGQHFMKPGMLPSQLAALERPQDAIVVDATPSIEDVASSVARHVRANS